MVDGNIRIDPRLEARRAALGLGIQPFARPARAPGDAAAEQAGARARLRDLAVLSAFAVIVVSVTVLQCFGLPLGDDASVPVAIPLVMLAIAALCFFVPPRINPKRLGLYFAAVIAAGLSTAFFADHYSTASIALFAVLYAPLVFSFPTTEANYRRCLDMFSMVMVVMVGLEFLQHAMQLVAGPLVWPNFYKLLPKDILIPQFVYLQPLAWKSHLDKPQAFFFLETSFLSQFLALALLVEVMVFRRIKRMALFAAGLFATFAGTGILLLALGLPLALGRMRLRSALLVTLVLLLVAGAAGEAGWLDLVGGRVSEFHKAGGSANHRFVEPLDRMIQFLGQSGSFYSGIGAGQIEKLGNHQFWPIAKAVIEYGLVPGLVFYAFFLYAMFDQPPMRRLAMVMVIWFTFEGALLTAVNPVTCLLTSMFFIEQAPVVGGIKARRPRRRGQKRQEGQHGATQVTTAE
jgi:hypothetical protein